MKISTFFRFLRVKFFFVGWGPSTEAPGPVFGDFGPAWGPTWGPLQARPLGRMEHFGGRDTGLQDPKGDCLPSQYHPG